MLKNNIVQVHLLGSMHPDEGRPTLGEYPDGYSFSGGHTGLRMVHPVPHLRLQRDALLRGYLPGREPPAQILPVLDQPCVLRHLHHRDGAQVGGARLQQILLQFLDHPRLYHRFRKCRFFSHRLLNVNYCRYTVKYNFKCIVFSFIFRVSEIIVLVCELSVQGKTKQVDASLIPSLYQSIINYIVINTKCFKIALYRCS